MNKVEKLQSNIKQNKVNNIIILIYNLYIQFIISESNGNHNFLGKKRFKENNGKIKSEKYNINKNFNVLFTLKKDDANKKIATEELNNLYNMRRMSSIQYYQLNDKKYSNNEFIPTISF